MKTSSTGIFVLLFRSFVLNEMQLSVSLSGTERFFPLFMTVNEFLQFEAILFVFVVYSHHKHRKHLRKEFNRGQCLSQFFFMGIASFVTFFWLRPSDGNFLWKEAPGKKP